MGVHGCSVALHGAAVCNFHMCVGGGRHKFPKMALESPAAALAMLHMFGVDSVAHRVPHHTRVLEVSGYGVDWLTCFLGLSRGASVQRLGVHLFVWHDVECFRPA